MKRLIIFLIILSASTISKAQQQGQLYVTSYDDTSQMVDICEGQSQGSVPVQYAFVNLNPSVPLAIDSIILHGDSNAFQYQEAIVFPGGLPVGEGGTGGGGAFTPTHIGDDTMRVTVYYNGQFTATASIIFHARNSPDLAMYGYRFTNAYSSGSYSFGSLNQGEELDTMHDQMGLSKSYFVGASPVKNGGIGPGDQPVILRSCGEATIDSIYESGDFSEFSFDPFPTLPYTMQAEDSIVLNFEFSPKVIDTQGTHHHYIIFHSIDGHYLTWSFEYRVYPTSSVSEATNSTNGIRIFPNPASDELQILGGEVGTVHLFDLLGRELLNANDDGTGASLDVSRLNGGTYFLRLGNQSKKVEIAR